MAYFAQLDDNNIVTQVIVVSDDDAPDPFPQGEAAGQQFIASLGLSGVWLQTSYNGNFRKNYAGIGHIYDTVRDAFIGPQPEPDEYTLEWVLDEDTCRWVRIPAPVEPHPEIVVLGDD
jgi:hypothetical protein